MHLYRVGYFSPEDGGDIVLTHVDSFTGEQFKALCLSCVPDAYRAEVEDGEGRGDLLPTQPGFGELYERVAHLLVARHGFEVAKFAAEASWFGWGHAAERGGWTNYGATDELADTLAAAGIPVRDSESPMPLTPF